ncbi:disulfide bond formation protein B [Salmonella enterica subsp. enterica]|nr:disulfide bond formation protein B [Salmonella enterica subsp. enterica]
MLRFLNQCSRGRGAWLLMAFTALALEMVALWFQHVMLLKPCVLCIYERCALFGRDGRGSGRRNSAENTAAIRGNGYLDLQRLAGSTTGV